MRWRPELSSSVGCGAGNNSIRWFWSLSCDLGASTEVKKTWKNTKNPKNPVFLNESMRSTNGDRRERPGELPMTIQENKIIRPAQRRLIWFLEFMVKITLSTPVGSYLGTPKCPKFWKLDNEKSKSRGRRAVSKNISSARPPGVPPTHSTHSLGMRRTCMFDLCQSYNGGRPWQFFVFGS